MHGAARTSILIVDDEPKNLVAAREIMDGPDRRLVLARSGAEALRHLLHNDFALILLDIQMPDMDGFEACELIRNRARSQRTPVIFMTGVYDDIRSVARGYALGAVDYVVKPVSLDILRAKVAVFVELASKRTELAAQIEQRESAEHALSRTNEDLEAIVRERTARLSVANELLRDEMEMRARAQESLRASETEARRLSLVASSTQNAVAIKDAHNRIEWTNASFERIYGYTPEEE